MEYNSQRSKLIIPEYGRITQKMAEYVCTIKDREKRTAAARQVIEIMTTFNPQFKNIEEYRQRLWDHLYIITDYKLDVDGPYPRKVYYDPRTGSARVRYLRSLANSTIADRERDYQRRLEADAPAAGSIDLF